MKFILVTQKGRGWHPILGSVCTVHGLNNSYNNLTSNAQELSISHVSHVSAHCVPVFALYSYPSQYMITPTNYNYTMHIAF